MATPIYQLGRVGRVYAAVESTYATAPALAATDAIRHLGVSLNSQLRNRVNAPTRHTHPSQIYRYTRRATANWSINGELFPSGTLNTLPDNTDFIQHAMGATPTNITLSTTATGVPTTVTTPCSAVTGLAVGQPVLLSIAAGGFAGKYVRWITAINTLTLTFAPALPAAQVAGDLVKGCIGYRLATAIASSLNIAHYLPNISYQGYGAVIDSLKLSFDANMECMWTASGPMQKRVRNAVTADPSTYTVVGTTPPSGLTGGLTFNATTEDMVKAEINITNAMALDNYAAGTSLARSFYRQGKRTVTVGIDAMVSDGVTLITAAEANSDAVVLLQCGGTEGSILAAYCPAAEFNEPDDPNDDAEMTWKYQGVCKASVAGNDELYVAFA